MAGQVHLQARDQALAGLSFNKASLFQSSNQK